MGRGEGGERGEDFQQYLSFVCTVKALEGGHPRDGVRNYPSWLLIRSCPVSYAAVLCLVTQRSSLQAEGEGRRRERRDDTKNGCV